MKAKSVTEDVKAMRFQKYVDKTFLGKADKRIDRINKYIDADITYFILAFQRGVAAVNTLDEFCNEVVKNIA